MDIALARTFLTIVSEGSFVAAANELHVTQSAVSLRVRRLEDMLGRPVFERSKAGVVMTPAGRQFERFAVAMMRIWEEARHQVAVPEGFRKTLMIGASPSLLPRLALRLVSRLELKLKDVAFRVESGQPDRLIRMLIEGVLDIAITYTPELRPGLEVEELYNEELVLVTSAEDFTAELDSRYVYIDWGPEFSARHGVAFPNHVVPRTTFNIGGMALDYVIRNRRAAYFPARLVREYLEDGSLELVANVPSISYPCYIVYNNELDETTKEHVLVELRRLARVWETLQDEIIDDLDDISEEED